MLKDSDRVLQYIVKNFVLNHKDRGARYIVPMDDLVRRYQNRTPEYLDLTQQVNQEAFNRAKNQCTRFVCKQCKRVSK